MGDILNNINTASNGRPYVGSVSSDVQISQVNQSPEMCAPVILKHSLGTSPSKRYGYKIVTEVIEKYWLQTID